MTVKAGWEKSTNGPDWTDVESLMRAMGGLHSGHVEFTVSPDGIGFGTGVIVTAVMTFDLLPGSQLPVEVTETAKWPSGDTATLAACVFKLLYELDFSISKVYANAALWE